MFATGPMKFRLPLLLCIKNFFHTIFQVLEHSFPPRSLSDIWSPIHHSVIFSFYYWYTGKILKLGLHCLVLHICGERKFNGPWKKWRPWRISSSASTRYKLLGFVLVQVHWFLGKFYHGKTEWCGDIHRGPIVFHLKFSLFSLFWRSLLTIVKFSIFASFLDCFLSRQTTGFNKR